MTIKKKKKNNDSNSAINAFMASREEVEQPKKDKKNNDGVDVDNDDFEAFVALSYVFDAIKAYKEQKSEELKLSVAHDRMYQQVCDKQQPTSFNAIRGKAKCMFVHNNHTPIVPDTDFPLTQTTIGDVFKKFNIHHEEVGVPEQLVINPDILKDQEILAKVAKALMKIENELYGLKVVLKQKATVKLKITDETFIGISKIKDESIRKALFDACSTIAVKSPKIESETSSFSDAFEILNRAGGIWQQIASKKQLEDDVKKANKKKK